MAMPNYQYAQLPVFQWRTYDLTTLTFSPHPIIPLERHYSNNPFADDHLKNDAPPPPVIDDIPVDSISLDHHSEDMEGRL